MKKKFYISNASYWNKLVKKFHNLNNKIRNLILRTNSSVTEINILLGRLKKIYKKLKSLQVKVGIKIAGSALALMLATASLDAQNFTYDGNLTSIDSKDIYVINEASPVFVDIDKDGDLDLFVGEKNVHIKCFMNIGNGIFSANGNLQADGVDIELDWATNLSFADLDNDNDFDLYIGNEGRIYVYINDGNGNFSANGFLQADTSDIYIDGGVASPTFADIDNDGDEDLYVGCWNGQIEVFLNDGEGNFTSNGYLRADGSYILFGSDASPVFADVDNDGDLDLYIGNKYGYVRLFTNDGNGNFSDAGNLQADGSEIDVGTYAFPSFADIDEDGDLDLYIGDWYGYVNVFLNDGNGNFSVSGKLQSINNDIDVGSIASPAFADLDNDGNIDLYVGNYDGYIQIFTNQGNNVFASSGYLQADGTDIYSLGGIAPVFADLDNDGDLDLYVGTSYGYILVYINEGNGNFTSNGKLQADGSAIHVQYWAALAFADLDNDGDLDLYVGQRYGNIKVFINDGNGNFTANGNFQVNGADLNTGYNPSPAFADFDHDGDLDLYVGTYLGKIKVYKNDGNQNFTEAGNLQADTSDIEVGYWASPVFVDIDRDGDLDLFVGNYSGFIKKYRNLEISSVSHQPNDLDIAVYPNPTTGIFTINLEESARPSRVFNCEVIDINGRVIKSYKNIGYNNLQIDLSNQSKGLYILKVYSDKAVKNVKIIIE